MKNVKCSAKMKSQLVKPTAAFLEVRRVECPEAGLSSSSSAGVLIKSAFSTHLSHSVSVSFAVCVVGVLSIFCVAVVWFWNEAGVIKVSAALFGDAGLAYRVEHISNVCQ